MAVLLNPYLSFRDQAKEAMEFYRSVFGGEVTTSVFGDYGMGGADEAAKIMHARLDADGLVLMAADTPNEAPYEQGNAFSVSLSGGAGDEQRLRSNWEGSRPARRSSSRSRRRRGATCSASSSTSSASRGW
ncbi:hypothetical protein GCM10025870_24460 [Agromyces marinus]|uniref:Glyoxalase/fosfomycin resistance/dioxygenase domain-containing protein n=1 Tax=Agromyces marinus TaxID=1389020 RepID=A0ABN6YIV6_9MICO|nr:hypothetical protein GCM10025870_24460 [Agromyces marinus]